MRYAILIILFLVVAFFAASPLFFKGVSIYMPLIAVALALALQKYVASIASYLLITFSRVFDVGDRVRIGNIKGDVRQVGLFHFILEEVGEDEKLGGELTGRLLHIPNLIVLDQPVLNYSKEYIKGSSRVQCDYIFDEVRIPLTPKSDVAKACHLLEDIISQADSKYVAEAQVAFRDGYPDFLKEAQEKSRTQIHIEPQHLWLKGKFVSPYRERNEMKTGILTEFLQRAKDESDIQLS
ncbi:MAG: mechanosensitive ion channel [Chloroflexi bacterium]|nr:mechanosensitive ion channel [Chloroflexota bacterium]